VIESGAAVFSRAAGSAPAPTPPAPPTPFGPVAIMGVRCPCGHYDLLLKRRGPRVTAFCGRCGRYVKHVSKDEIETALIELPEERG
jgi:hypothetical protein